MHPYVVRCTHGTPTLTAPAAILLLRSFGLFRNSQTHPRSELPTCSSLCNNKLELLVCCVTSVCKQHCIIFITFTYNGCTTDITSSLKTRYKARNIFMVRWLKIIHKKYPCRLQFTVDFPGKLLCNFSDINIIKC